MKLIEITEFLNAKFPLSFQESYDNSGLIYGDPFHDIHKILVTLDVTEEVIEEALREECDLIISHHPPVFKEIKKINPSNYTDRVLIEAIRQNIALYALHTNIDNISGGLNFMLSQKLGIINPEVLQQKKGHLRKLVTFCPTADVEKIRDAIFKAGAGHIGNYKECSFNIEGKGTFFGSEYTNPYVGEKGKLHIETETRIETVYPATNEVSVLKALFSTHPYEEVAYDIYNIENVYSRVGAGAIGYLDKEYDECDFIDRVLKNLPSERLMHSRFLGRPVKKVAVCGGSGAFLIHEAIKQKADVFVTGEIKYHEFFGAENSIVLVAAGHYETEHFVKEIIANAIKENFPNFAVVISNVYTNAINYK